MLFEILGQTQKIECRRFHLTQAWYCKIQELGLSVEYNNDDSEVVKWLRYVYVDPNEAGDVFVFSLTEFMSQNDKLEKFSSYMVDNYISEEATYPPIMWAWAPASTTKTSLFIFLNALEDFQTEVYIKIQSVQKENRPGGKILTQKAENTL